MERQLGGGGILQEENSENRTKPRKRGRGPWCMFGSVGDGHRTELSLGAQGACGHCATGLWCEV